MSKAIDYIGLDSGTWSILAARIKNDELEIKKETNCFLPIEIDESNRFLINMIKQSGAPLVEVDGISYILGEAARKLSLSVGRDYCRPMKNGIINPNEIQSFNILAVIIRSLIGELTADETVIAYGIPGQSLNIQTNQEYHQKIIKSILEKYKQGDKVIKAFPINEALCVVYSELSASKNKSGLGISFGGGQCNICLSSYGMPLVQFALVNSGDWIDQNSAEATGEKISYVNEYKKNIDISQEPKNAIERALHFNYEIMIENSLKGIVDGLKKAGSKAQFNEPIDIAIAGGTAKISGFLPFFQKTLERNKLPLPIGEIKVSKDPIAAVCKGALLAAQAHQD
jgi:hypothetical protein